MLCAHHQEGVELLTVLVGGRITDDIKARNKLAIFSELASFFQGRTTNGPPHAKLN